MYNHYQDQEINFEIYSGETKIRLINSLWILMVNTRRTHLQDDDYLSNNRIQLLIEALKKEKISQKNIDYHADNLSEPKNINWIQSINTRQHAFIHHQLQELKNRRIKIKYIKESRVATGKNLIIAMFDLFQADMTTKDNLIEGLEKRWMECIRHDEIFSWFDTDTEKKVLTAINWFYRHEKEKLDPAAPIETLDDIKILFDRLYPHKDTKDVMIKKIKRCFIRSNDTGKLTGKKSALYIEITEQQKKTLKLLAKSRNITMKKLIEDWILMAVNNNNYY